MCTPRHGFGLLLLFFFFNFAIFEEERDKDKHSELKKFTLGLPKPVVEMPGSSMVAWACAIVKEATPQ